MALIFRSNIHTSSGDIETSKIIQATYKQPLQCHYVQLCHTHQLASSNDIPNITISLCFILYQLQYLTVSRVMTGAKQNEERYKSTMPWAIGTNNPTHVLFRVCDNFF